MRLQVLISAVNREPEDLIEQMHLSSDAVLVNQCDRNDELVIHTAFGEVKVLSRAERGVGKSRNLAFAHSDAEIVLFSDEDIRYREGYAKQVAEAFAANPRADILLFNFDVCEARRTYYNNKEHRVHSYNCGRYPAYSIAARREKLCKAGVVYSELFGGGAQFSNGEDSLFLMDAIRAGLRVYTTTTNLGVEEPRESTWFFGYTEKFFTDRGVLFAFLYGRWAKLWARRFVIQKKEAVQGEIGRKRAYELICRGIKEGRQLCKKR